MVEATYYHTEFEVVSVTKSVTKNNDVRFAIKSATGIIYSGLSTGKFAIEGIDKLEQGDYVTAQCEDSADGKYHNIKKIMDVGKASAGSKIPEKVDKPSVVVSGASTSAVDTRQVSIERQCAMKCAIELAVAGKIETDQLIASAEKILEWIEGK